MRGMALGTLDGVIGERALLARYNATQGALTSTLRRLMLSMANTRGRLSDGGKGAAAGPSSMRNST